MKPLAALGFCLVSIGIFGGLAAPAPAAEYDDPTWPCIQRKVEALSIGLMWPAPIEDMDLAPDTARAANDLADTLILRRIELEEAQRLVDAFAEAHGRDPALMGHVFGRVFKGLDTRRTALIEGIGEYSLSQIALSERIDAARSEMDALMEADAPDFDKVDKLEEQVDWDERVYMDRQQALTYVCETPVLLEKRLYALAQMLMDASNS